MIPDYAAKLQEMWERYITMQASIMEALTSALDNMVKLNVLKSDIAVFRARIQSGGRISIPETERSALNLGDGDIVKVILIKEKGGDGSGV